jgi:hypothetical protein
MSILEKPTRREGLWTMNYDLLADLTGIEVKKLKYLTNRRHKFNPRDPHSTIDFLVKLKIKQLLG